MFSLIKKQNKTITDLVRQIAIERGGVPAERIRIVRNGPPLSFLEYAQPYPEIANSNKVVFGYAGSIGIQDGLD